MLMDWSIWLPSFWSSTLDTLYMVSVAALFTVFLGLPLGVLLVATDSRGLTPAPALNQVVGVIVNAARSLPFIILLVAVIPFTRLVAGTSIGATRCNCAAHAGSDPVLCARGRDQPARS
jgi:D-methionine transport system permease protein